MKLKYDKTKRRLIIKGKEGKDGLPPIGQSPAENCYDCLGSPLFVGIRCF